MAELIIIIDCLQHEELQEYLTSLNGILDVSIKNEEQLEIYINYNPDLISIDDMKKIELKLNI